MLSFAPCQKTHLLTWSQLASEVAGLALEPTALERKTDDSDSCIHTRIRNGFAKVHTDSHGFATDSRMDSRAFATHSQADSPGFPRIPQDSPGFPRIPEGFTRIRGFAQNSQDSRGCTPICRCSLDMSADSRMDLRGFAKVRGWIYADSHKIHSD